MSESRWVRDIRVFGPGAPPPRAGVGGAQRGGGAAHPPPPALLAILRTAPLGDFGRYREVVELALGYEGFRPGVGAVPTLGAVGAASWSPTVILTGIYDAEADVEALADALLAAHPWDVPVMAVSEPYRLLMRG